VRSDSIRATESLWCWSSFRSVFLLLAAVAVVEAIVGVWGV